MDLDEAYKILNVTKETSKEDMIAVHRSLIMPDTYASLEISEDV